MAGIPSHPPLPPPPVRERLLYLMAGPPGNPEAARDPHHHLVALVVGNRAWMIAGYSEAGTAIARRRAAAWKSRSVPEQIGFITIDFATEVTWFHRSIPGHRTTLDVEDAHSRPLIDLSGLRPSGEMSAAAWRSVLNTLEDFAKWDRQARPNLTRYRQKDFDAIAHALRPPPTPGGR